MKTSLIRIGNSKGVRIPQPLLEESGIEDEADISAKKGEIRIVPIKKPRKVDPFLRAAEETFAREWLTPEEDEAWKVYQPEK